MGFSKHDTRYISTCSRRLMNSEGSITGTKKLTTNVGVAALYNVLAKTRASLFVVERSAGAPSRAQHGRHASATDPVTGLRGLNESGKSIL